MYIFTSSFFHTIIVCEANPHIVAIGAASVLICGQRVQATLVDDRLWAFFFQYMRGKYNICTQSSKVTQLVMIGHINDTSFIIYPVMLAAYPFIYASNYSVGGNHVKRWEQSPNNVVYI